MDKKASFKPIIWIMVISLAIAFFWDKIPFLKSSVGALLNPTAGALLNWNLTWGMFIIIFVIALLTTLIQKYTTDQEALKKLKVNQKALQKEMKKYRDQPAKMTELQKQSMAAIPETFKLTSRSIVYTGIPFILLFRWFMDFFAGAGDPRFLLGLNWFWFYLIFTMIFSGILRKYLKVA